MGKPLWVSLFGVALAVIAITIGGDSDRERFDRLKIGMSVKDVNSILSPPSKRFHARAAPDLRSNQDIRFNGRIILRIRSGRLVAKEWTD